MSTDTIRPKIAFIITKSNWGGAQKNVYDIATHLDPKKFDVVVILGGHGLLKKKLSELGIHTVSIDSMERDISLFKELKTFNEILKVLKEEKPSILHVHSPKAAGIGSLAGRILGIKKIVYTIHGWTFNEQRPLVQKIMILIASWITTLLATDIVTISKKETEQTKEFPYIKNKVTYIPIGIREQTAIRENIAREFIESKIGISLKNKFVVGMIGELHQNKGLFYAIEAFKKLPDNIVLTIIGGGEQEQKLKQEIEKSGLQQRVFLLGFVDNAATYAKAFDTLLMSSIKEGLPYVLLEVGSLGVPLVATVVGGIPEIIDDMKSGILIQPNKPVEILYAINFMYEHPDLRAEYGRNGIKKIKGEFNLQRMVTSIEHVYTIQDLKTRGS